MHLNSLNPESIRDWNAAGAEERTMDVAWLLQPGTEPQQQTRLRFFGHQLVDWTAVTGPDVDRVLPLAVIPPLINPHVHLEFSSRTEPVQPASPFPDWIRAVIRWRLDHPGSAADGICAGLRECRQHGVSGIGEITTSDDVVSMLQQDAVDVVSFRELIGLLPDRVPDQICTMERHLDALSPGTESGTVRPGISPHAPYSVHPDLVAATVDLCGPQSVPVAMHLAETRDELELLAAGTGRFAEFLQEMNLWNDSVLPRGGTVLRYLQQLAKVPRALAIHGNYLSDDEIRFLGRHPQIAIVYCPRTHHYFGHPGHPWRQIRQAGGTVVLGTDGRSSNPDLSIWRELQFLADRHQDATVEELLPMVTTQAAVAIGLESDLNSAERFRATLIELPRAVKSLNDCVLSSASRPMGRLMSDGSVVQLESAVD